MMLKINKKYAAVFQRKKEAEERFRLQEKYGELTSSSSSDEEEDSDAEAITDEVECNFLCTLSLIKERNPKIYCKDTQFYSQQAHKPDGEGKAKGNKKNPKAMYLKDYERMRLQAKGSMAGVSDSEEEGEKVPVTYEQELQGLKKSFIQAVEEEEEEDQGMEEVLTLREKSKEEKEGEEQDYVEWLRGNQTAPDNTAVTKDLEALRRCWVDPSLDPDEAFLRDYILNKGYVDKDAKRIPTYKELVETSSSDSEEEEEFERIYNFRFEEPDGALIARYPRTMAGSVRRVDNQRKEKRKEREERKAKEKERKKGELKRLKNLKMKEIKGKLERIQQITGNDVHCLEEKDLEGDFDPQQHDEAMQRLFGDQFYAQREGDVEKPYFGDSEEDGYVDWDEWNGAEEDGEWEEEGGPHCEDPDFNMDADYDPQAMASSSSSSSSRAKQRKRKYQSRFASAVTAKKPVFDPKEKNFEDYLEEYYNLDYEDVIDDLPCRFKYRFAPANNFGLTTEEILCCDNKELNRWASLKKAIQYRTLKEEAKDRRRYKAKSRDLNRKYQVLASLREDTGPSSPSSQTRHPRPPQEKGRRQGKKSVGSAGRPRKISKARMMAYKLTKKPKRKAK